MSFSSPPPHELIGPVLHQDEIAGFVFGLTEPQHYELLVTGGNIVTILAELTLDGVAALGGRR